MDSYSVNHSGTQIGENEACLSGCFVLLRGVCVQFKDRVFCSSDWPWTHYVSKNDLELLIPPPLLSLSPECWNYKLALLCHSAHSAADQLRDFMHARQALYPLSYNPGPLIWLLYYLLSKIRVELSQFPLGCPLPSDLCPLSFLPPLPSRSFCL